MADIGVVGLGVMGQNLILNMDDHGFEVAAYNRTWSITELFLNGAAKGTRVHGVKSLQEMVAALSVPRRVLLMITAGGAVDHVISDLIPLLDDGDIIIDGGNSHYEDTERRAQQLKNHHICFIGMGVSGGEEGARRGPSLMPGGHGQAWPKVSGIFQAIAAKAPDGTPCCDWLGEGGTGHYVKMTHNGIEYGDMQLIAEAYHFMREGLGMPCDEIADVFAAWNKGELNSYLIEITAEILRYKDVDGQPLVDKILDMAGQKGTGKWVGIAALSLGAPVTLIAEAVFARYLSVMKDERLDAAGRLAGPKAKYHGDKAAALADLAKALYASKIVSYAQGFLLLREAAIEYKWELNYGTIASLWRAGCIIRSAFLGRIKEAYDKRPTLPVMLLDDYFRDVLAAAQESWRRTVGHAVNLGIAVPAFSAALSFYDGYRTARLPASLIQAQRDYFGAHSYERLDKARGELFHTNWGAGGGTTAAGSFNL